MSDLPPIRLTERDKAILLAVSKYRFLTTSQVLSLVPGSRQNIIRRLQRLFHAGFLDRPKAQLPRRFAGDLKEFVYSVTRKGASNIAAANWRTYSGRGYKPTSSLFLSHTLLVSEVLIRIEFACQFKGTGFVSESAILDRVDDEEKPSRFLWRTSVKSGSKTEIVGIVPDAAFAIDRKDKAGGMRRLYFFLEADRGTMPLYRKSLRLSSIRRKALAYFQSRQRKILKERYGIPGFQVLFVTQSEARLERMKKVCRAATDGKDTSLFLFTTLTDVQAGNDPLTQIIRGGE